MTTKQCDACRAVAVWQQINRPWRGERLAWCELHFRERVLTGYSRRADYVEITK